MFNVPQFIDIEDKVAGPLTWKQLLWMIGMGVSLLVLFNVFDQAFFYVTAVPVVLIFVALAFYKPGGISMPRFIFYGFLFLFRPKVSVWERPLPRASSRSNSQSIGKSISSEMKNPEEKRLTQDTLKELADILDRKQP